MSFSADQPVSLPYHGPAPDLGPFEYEGIPFNRAPVLLTIGDRQGEETKPVEFQVEGVDPDRESRQLLRERTAAGRVFRLGERTFQWTPAVGQAEPIPESLLPSLTRLPSVSETITITVHPKAPT